MVAGKPKQAPSRSRPTRKPKRYPPQDDSDDGVVLSPRLIKWAAGAIGALLGALVAWFAVWDRIENHWRLETIQATRDKQLDAEIKATRDKADADTKALAKRAEVGRSWLFYNLSDFRADNSQQWAQVCTALKQPPEVCSKWQADASQLRQEATEARRAASDAGKSPP